MDELRNEFEFTRRVVDADDRPLDPDETDDLALGFSFLRALAGADESLREIRHGVWRVTREPGDWSVFDV